MTAEPQALHPQDVTIDPADIRWRVGQISKKDPHKGSLLGYIDARTCMEALDQLDPEWSAVHGDPIIVGGELVGVPCRVTVNGVTRSDVGMPSSQEPIKGAYSDALKRAAVHFGIGRELYELPRIYVKLDDYKKPVAIPVYRNGRWTLPSGAGSVFYDREPDEQPAGAERADSARRESRQPATTSAPAQRTPEEQALIGQLLDIPQMTVARASLLADAVGVPKGSNATADQLRAMIAKATTPLDSPGQASRAHEGVPPAPASTSAPSVADQDAPASEGGEGSDSSPTNTPDPESVPSGSATPTASDSPPVTAPSAAPTDAEILAAAGPGAEIVPPKRRKGRTVEEAIADAKQKAAKKEPVQESLAEALGNPVADA